MNLVTLKHTCAFGILEITYPVTNLTGASRKYSHLFVYLDIYVDTQE